MYWLDLVCLVLPTRPQLQAPKAPLIESNSRHLADWRVRAWRGSRVRVFRPRMWSLMFSWFLLVFSLSCFSSSAQLVEFATTTFQQLNLFKIALGVSASRQKGKNKNNKFWSHVNLHAQLTSQIPNWHTTLVNPGYPHPIVMIRVPRHHTPAKRLLAESLAKNHGRISGLLLFTPM